MDVRCLRRASGHAEPPPRSPQDAQDRSANHLSVLTENQGRVHLRKSEAGQHSRRGPSGVLPAKNAPADCETVARLRRRSLPGISQRVFQRGKKRLPGFSDNDDRQRHLTWLRDALLETGGELHAHGLLDIHVHLPATPPQIRAIAQLMHKTTHGHVGWFNARPRPTEGSWKRPT